MREQFTWNVSLQAETGEIVERKVKAYWSPKHEGIEDFVGRTAAGEAYWAANKHTKFAPVAVVRAK